MDNHALDSAIISLTESDKSQDVIRLSHWFGWELKVEPQLI